MGRIRKPSSFESLLKEVSREEWLKLTGKYSAIDRQGRYLQLA